MNINVVNHLYNSGIAINYIPTQLPNLPLVNNITIVNHSGSTGLLYLGNNNVTWQNGFPLQINAGVCIAVDNANLVYGVCESGYTASLRYLCN